MTANQTRRFRALPLLCLGLVLSMIWLPGHPRPVPPHPVADPPLAAPDRVIIRLVSALDDPSFNRGSLDVLLARFDIQDVIPLFHAERGDVTLKALLGLDRAYVLFVPPSSNLQPILAAFSAHPAVEYAERDWVGAAAWWPDDERFPEQWALVNTGQDGGTPGADVDAPGAWQVTTGLSGTVLAIIDTGVDLDHPDLAGQLLPGYDFVNDDAIPQDDHGHGTHVAGIAAAVTDNGTGIAGVCPACRIMPLKALNADNWGYYSWWAQAIEYAVDHGADVINMSMGGTGFSQTLNNAVLYAYHANVPIVAAMMNDGSGTPYYPARYAETIAVGATDRHDRRATFSNHGIHIDLVAPGEAILSTLWDDEYAAWSGTSMAVPHVVGTLGLIHAAYPDASVEELRALLWATADDQVGWPGEDVPGWDRYHGAGRLNAARAVASSVPLAGVDLAGPAAGVVLGEVNLLAVSEPVTAALYVTYTWQATGHAPLVRTGGVTDTAAFSWSVPGSYTVTVSAANHRSAVSATHQVTVIDGIEAVVTVGPLEGGVLNVVGADGVTVTVRIPPGAVTTTTQIGYASALSVTDVPVGWAFTGAAFALEGYRAGVLRPNLGLARPITLTVAVEPGAAARAELRRRNEDGWSTEDVWMLASDPAAHCVTATAQRLGWFALFTRQRWEIYLPLVVRAH